MGDRDDRPVVVDRRASAGATDEPPRETKGVEPSAASGVRPDGAETDAGRAPLPPVDFVSFVLSLAATAMAHLGLARDEEGRPFPVDLERARQTIDLLAMLEQKTAGNLTGEEERVLSQTLLEVRLAFVQRSRG
ncbi:MAG: DUF1844 domain-containing protein [Myxococcota bacterium]|nr:DUF1844 domain-containing protein [Myxococcota bacterium]MDW8362266.1 DUF1844 domain-containing protein [Myxococcales bacterium]